MIKLLAIEGVRGKDDLYRHPSWEIVSGFLRRLDGTTVTYMTLYKTEDENEDEYLMIGGGGEHYICEYVVNGQKHHLLSDSNADSEGMISVPVGNTGKFPGKYCVSYEEVLPNVRYFYGYGCMNPAYRWDTGKRMSAS